MAILRGFGSIVDQSNEHFPIGNNRSNMPSSGTTTSMSVNALGRCSLPLRTDFNLHLYRTTINNCQHGGTRRSRPMLPPMDWNRGAATDAEQVAGPESPIWSDSSGELTAAT